MRANTVNVPRWKLSVKLVRCRYNLKSMKLICLLDVNINVVKIAIIDITLCIFNGLIRFVEFYVMDITI